MKYIILRGPNRRFIAKALRPEFSTPIIGNPVIIESEQEPTKTVVQVAWESGADIERHGATLVSLAPALGLTDEQVDTMFIQAAALRV